MIWIVILAVLGLILGVALFTPGGIRLQYDRGEIKAWARFGPMRFSLYPRPEEPEEKILNKAEEQQKAPKKKAEQGKKLRINGDQLLYSLETLPPILGRALRRVGRRLRIAPLKVHLLVAGTDPADTAQLYGRLEAALAAGLPRLHQLVKIREQDIQLFLDFQETAMDCIADVGLSLRLWDVLAVLLCAGGSLLKWFMGFRKLADRPPENTEKPPKSGENKQGPAGAGAA